MIFQALTRGWTDLLRGPIGGLLARGVLLSLLLLGLLQTAIFWAIRLFAPEFITLPVIGKIAFSGYLSWSSLLLLPLMGIFLMIPVAAAFSGLYAERVASTVERIHYPDRQGQPLDFWDGLLESLAVMAAVLLITLIVLAATPFLGPLAPVVFYGANGWLLGREFFQMAAQRHLSAERATTLRRTLSTQITALGVMVAFLLSVPILNLVVPVLAAAAFTHLYHLSQTSGSRLRG